MIGITAKADGEQIVYADSICKAIRYPEGYRVNLFDTKLEDGTRYGILRSNNVYLCFPISEVILDRPERVKRCKCGGRFKVISVTKNPFGKKRKKQCVWCGKRITTAVTGEGENIRETIVSES